MTIASMGGTSYGRKSMGHLELPSIPAGSQGAPDLLSRAAAVLARETSRMQAVATEALGGGPSFATLGAGRSAGLPLAALAPPGRPNLTGLGTPDVESLRRHAHELVETLLAVVQHPAPREPAGSPEGQVPHLYCLAPVDAGGDARATLRVTNEEGTAMEVTLYSTPFVADTGYEIPSLHLHASPRRALVPANGEVAVEVKISVPRQTPAGHYSGLIQASGCRYVKAVLSLEVL